MKKSSLAFLLLIPLVFAHGAGRQLTGVYAPTPTPALSPPDAQSKFVVPEGFQVRLFAADPDVVNPVAMTWDERGRLWVLELYEYPMGAAPGTKPRDRIKILEDTDNDGRADKITVFADGLNLATGLALGNGGVYVGQAPDLLFLQDTNHDDIADTRTALLTGFGLGTWSEVYPGFARFDDGLFANQAHNDWAQWAAEGGIPFFLIMLAVVAGALRPAFRSLWGLGLLAVFIHCLVDYPMQQRPALAAFFFALLGIVNSYHRQASPGRP